LSRACRCAATQRLHARSDRSIAERIIVKMAGEGGTTTSSSRISQLATARF
jgi:hypothetical protein